MSIIDFSIISEKYINEIIDICINYYDIYNINNLDLSISIQNLKQNINITKENLEIHIKYLIELINKENSIHDISNKLLQKNMKKNNIQYLLNKRIQNIVKIENVKHFELKDNKNRILDFKYSFLCKYANDKDEKVEFFVIIELRYKNDSSEEKLLTFDMKLSQFFSLINDFNKIDMIIKTLV